MSPRKEGPTRRSVRPARRSRLVCRRSTMSCSASRGSTGRPCSSVPAITASSHRPEARWRFDSEPRVLLSRGREDFSYPWRRARGVETHTTRITGTSDHSAVGRQRTMGQLPSVPVSRDRPPAYLQAVRAAERIRRCRTRVPAGSLCARHLARRSGPARQARTASTQSGSRFLAAVGVRVIRCDRGRRVSLRGAGRNGGGRLGSGSAGVRGAGRGRRR